MTKVPPAMEIVVWVPLSVADTVLIRLSWEKPVSNVALAVPTARAHSAVAANSSVFIVCFPSLFVCFTLSPTAHPR